MSLYKDNGYSYSLLVDGDVLNVFLIINDAFYTRANQILNPSNAFFISNNDGKLNMDIMPSKDILINSNTLVRLGRKYYTAGELEEIKLIKEGK